MKRTGYRAGRAASAAACLGLALVASASAVTPVAGQSSGVNIEDFAGAYLGSNAQGYFGPLAEALTGSLNSGFVAPLPKTDGFSVRLGLLTPMALFGTGQKTFTATTEPGFRPTTTMEVPTIVGSAELVMVEGEAGSGYIFPSGLNISSLGVALPQLTVGGFGTEVTLRWAGLSVDEELGDLSLLGGGLRHNVSQYFGALPLDIGVGIMASRLKLGETLDATALLLTLQGSRRLGWFDLYGGLGYESSSMDIRYDSDAAEGGRVAVDLEGVNGVRATLGAGLFLPLVGLTADVSMGSQTLVGLGLSFGTRY